MLYIGLNREKHEKIFLSETIRRRAMIFCMKHHLVKNAPPGGGGGSHILHLLI